MLKDEKSLSKHFVKCPTKRRYDEEFTDVGQLAYKCWLIFMEDFRDNDKSYVAFAGHRTYRGFRKFAEYVQSFPINSDEFVRFLLSMCVKLTSWTDEKYLESYIKKRMMEESPEMALARCITEIEKWSLDRDINISEFYTQIPAKEVVYMFKMGRLSPWLLFCSNNSDVMLKKLDQYDMHSLSSYIDSGTWKIKVRRYKEQCEKLKGILGEYSL